MSKITLGTRLRSRREELAQNSKDYSVRKVAARAEISAAYLSLLEKGKNSAPSNEILKKLASELILDFAELSILSERITSELTSEIKSRPRRIQEMLQRIDSIPKTKFKEYTDEMNDVAIELGSPAVKNKNVSSARQKSKPDSNQQDTAQWGVQEATKLLKDNGFKVRFHPEFPSTSNALLAEKKGLLPNNRVKITVFPKTSKSTRLVRLGGEAFVSQRQETNEEEFYFGFVPEAGSDNVYEGVDLFIIPAKVAASDGLLVHDLYLSRGKQGIGVVIKDVKREPHKSIMDRWKRCFLYPNGVDWLPR